MSGEGSTGLACLGNGKANQDGFVKPLPPSRLKFKASLPQPTPPVRKRKSRFSDAPPSLEAPPPKILQTIPSLPGVGDIQSAQIAVSDNKAALVSVAAAAAARINASLLAQGKIKSLPTASNPQLTSQSTASSMSTDPPNPALAADIKKIDDMYAAEVEINDIPVGCRNYLTRLSTQENINKSCMAFVSTRGKYMTTDEKKQHPLLLGGEKPLYLFVQSQSEVNINKALERIKQIINNHYDKKSKYLSEALAQIASLSQKATVNANTSGVSNPVLQAFTPGYPLIPTTTAVKLPHFQPALPSGNTLRLYQNFMQEKVFIGMDSLPEHFDLKNKLLGPNYRNFNFIANQTGAKVILRGKGSGFIEPTSGREAFESMYAFISHPNQTGVEAAKKLVLNLVETVKKELGPLLKSTHSAAPLGFNSSQSTGAYNSVPPPMSAFPPNTPANILTAYPFQQSNIAPMPVQRPTKQSYTDEGSQVASYQHNFAGSDYSSRSDPATKRSKDKPRKRFTEESPMPPPPLSSSERSQATENKSNGDKLLDSTTKRTSLPFWMTN